MQAFRNVNGSVREITIDVDLNGNPILPPNTTVDPRPEEQPGHYLTVVGTEWVQIPIPVTEITLEQAQKEACDRLKIWRDWYLDQPVEFDTSMFDADAEARTRLTQAVTLNAIGVPLPAGWVTEDNGFYPFADFEALKSLALAVSTAFTDRFFEAVTIRNSITATTTKAELEAITIPQIPL